MEYVVKTACFPCQYKVEPRDNATSNFFLTEQDAREEIRRLAERRANEQTD